MIWKTNKYGNKYPILNKQIKLSYKEKGMVKHNINTYANQNQRKIGKYNIKPIRNHFYIYKYNDMDTIEFYGKIKIVGNERKIEIVYQYINEVNKNGFF